ncbi:MAG: GNAT family N-acetyltransferase [Ignavibacteriae bacterium]|nr:GNAT family N-acetyltransferase [Ignavibacteriota bacterium]
MDKFPEIKTSRLILGKLSINDIPKIIEYASNKKIADTTLNIPHPYEVRDAIFWINNANKGFENKSQFTFGIKIKTNYEFIGGIGLKINNVLNQAELGYWIAEKYWNKGFATEAVEAIIKFGFKELHLNKICASHLEQNPASGKVLIKNGMIKEGELIMETKKDDHYKVLIQYRLNRTEFDNRKSTLLN